MPSLLLLDPLTLLGRELIASLEATAVRPTVEYRHTSDEDEHQVAEIAGEAALVVALDDPDELLRFDVVVIASDEDTDRVRRVGGLLDSGPGGTRVVDLGGCAALRGPTRPAVSVDASERHQMLRVAHPALVALDRIRRAYEPFGVAGGALAATEPVSARGGDAIERLARQAVARLQGEPPGDLIDDLVLAFNHVPVDAGDLEQDARLLFPDLDLAVTRAYSGLFHGHLAVVTLELEEPISASDASAVLEDDVALVMTDLRTPLDRIVDSDRIAVAPPALSASGRRVAVAVAADGLRLTAATGWTLAAHELWVS